MEEKTLDECSNELVKLIFEMRDTEDKEIISNIKFKMQEISDYIKEKKLLDTSKAGICEDYMEWWLDNDL